MVAVCHCSINREIPRFEYDICLHRFARNSFVADKSALNLIVPFFNWTRLTFGCYNTACLPVWLKCHQYYIETCQIIQIERERERGKANIHTDSRAILGPLHSSPILHRRTARNSVYVTTSLSLTLASSVCVSSSVKPDRVEASRRDCVVILYPNVRRARSLFFPLSE